jgi:hypothetical protein
MATASIAHGATHANPATPIFGNADASNNPASTASAKCIRSLDCGESPFNGGELA